MILGSSVSYFVEMLRRFVFRDHKHRVAEKPPAVRLASYVQKALPVPCRLQGARILPKQALQSLMSFKDTGKASGTLHRPRIPQSLYAIQPSVPLAMPVFVDLGC